MNSIPKGYKKTEVGVIPEDWETTRLGHLFDFLYGKQLPSHIVGHQNYPVYGTNGPFKTVNSYLFNGESIIVGRKGAIRAIHYAPSNAWVIDTAFYSIQKRTICMKAIYYRMSLIDLSQMDSGSAIPSTNKQELENIRIALPPLREQKIIAEVLSDMDALIEAQKELIAKKRDIKQGTMQDLLSGRVRLPGYETKGWKHTDIGDIPDDWEINRLGLISQTITKGTTPKTMGFDFKKTGINFIKIEAISENGRLILSELSYIDEKCHNAFKRSQLESGDILFSIAGALGRHLLVKSCILPSNINQALAIIRLKNIDKNYIYHYLGSSSAKSYIKNSYSQGAQSNLSLRDVKYMNILLPSPREQQAIAQVLSDMDDELETLEAELEKLHHMKRGMMQELLTGRIRLI